MKIKSKKLNKAVDEFVDAMKTELAKKESEGYTGWNKEGEISTENLLGRSIDKIKQLQKLPKDLHSNAVDVANFMMMVYYRRNKK